MPPAHVQLALQKDIQGLFSKIYKFVFKEVIPNGVNITFSPPKMLQIERETEQMETVSRLISALSELGISKEYLKKKYLSIDWKELEAFETKEALDKKTKPEGGEEDQFGGQQY